MFCKKNKILIAINNLNFGGAEKLVLDQINFLFDNGYDVSLLTTIGDKQSNFFDKLRIPESKIYKIKRGKYRLLSSVLFIRKIILNEKFNLIVSHLFHTNTLTRLAIIFLIKRPIFFAYEHNDYSADKKRRHLLVDKVLLLFTDRVIVVSESVRNYLLKNKINEKKIILIENGVYFPDVKVDIKSKKSELGIPDDAIVIVSVGNVTKQKGHDILLMAAEKILQQSGNIYFIVCGSCDGVYAKNLIKKSDSMGGHFKFLGSRVDVLEIVKMSDMYVMPSRWEGLSIALLEALYLRKNIIVSEIESMQRVIINGNNGLFFQPENSDDLADKILYLISNEEKIKSMGNCAYLTSRKYSIENNIRGILDNYNLVLKDKNN
ncbi:MAG: glycosyltransferase family 4 protein [Candidatus Moranbacteria bacterium]|nr:glycosyltransferase family 4 protein [Candidatus Moranbacteria bacterium]